MRAKEGLTKTSWIRSPKSDAQLDDDSVQEVSTFVREAESVVDMAQKFYSDYVYTNVVESRDVGDNVLLLIVHIEGKHEDMETELR